MLRSARAGFSLIELLVAVGVMGVVMVYALGTFTYQHQTYVVVDQVSEIQQNVRAAAALIERDARGAGYMTSPETSACGVDNSTGPDLLFLSDTDAIQTADALPSELANRRLGAEPSNAIAGVDAGDAVAFTVDDVSIDANPSYDTDGDGANDSDFRVGAGAILADVANPARGVACGIVTAVNPPAAVSVTFRTGLAVAAALASDYRLVPAHVYELATPAGSVIQLQRDGALLAKDIEDFQVAWFYDDDSDGELDAGEMRGVTGTDYNTTLVDNNDLREIRVNLVARTRDDDPRKPDSAGTGQPTENRTAASAPGDDGRRRRVHTSIVRLRNLNA
jgi:prepilin-type N-terminal cleavage/methylation domain-containing protein